MKNLLDYILNGILKDQKFKIEETPKEGYLLFTISLSSDLAGLVIGKNGKTIKAIKNILRVKAILEGKDFYLDVISG